MFEKLKKYKTPLYFVNSTLFSSFLGIIGGFFTYRYIAPEQLGIWVTLTTFTVYATFIRLGIPNGLNREMPYFLGKGEVEKANSYAETTLAYSLFNSLLLLFVSIIGSLLYFPGREFDAKYLIALPVFFIKIIIEPYSTYLSSTFRTNNNFKKLSDIQIVLSITKLLSIILVALWGLKGYLLRELIGALLNCFLLHHWRPLPQIKPKFDIQIFKQLFNVGFRIFVASYIASVIDTLPRLFLIKEASTMTVGFFSPIIMMIGIISLVPKTLNAYLYPKFSQKFGEGVERIVFWNYIKKIYFLSILLSSVGGVLLYYTIDVFAIVFPKYIEAIPYMKLSCLAILFVGYNLGGVLYIVFKEWKMYFTYILFLGCSQLLSLLILNFFFEDKLKIVVISLIFTYSTTFLYNLFASYKMTHIKG